MWVNDDQLLWKKAQEAYNTRKNGEIYKDHPFISNIRLLISGMKEMNVEKIRSFFSENAVIYDVMNAGVFEYLTLDEEMKNIENAFKSFEILNIGEVGYPDTLAYEGGNVVILSWWRMRIKKNQERLLL